MTLNRHLGNSDPRKNTTDIVMTENPLLFTNMSYYIFSMQVIYVKLSNKQDWIGFQSGILLFTLPAPLDTCSENQSNLQRFDYRIHKTSIQVWITHFFNHSFLCYSVILIECDWILSRKIFCHKKVSPSPCMFVIFKQCHTRKLITIWMN